MSRRAPQGLQTQEEASSESSGPGDIHGLLARMQDQMEASLRAQFLDVERAVAKSMGERLAGADALIARLSAENARLEKENAAIPHLSSENMRLQQENAKHQRTLERLRELALADKP